ncbi:hypothetical protein [Nocardia sp. 852002-20019_SCH5090214]|uniref:hypothetical protein n=1 Tax=Nocardia sp. 852002-20019_SCH5090214 TaxID=1834087 RepID=UPI001E63F712|nr:hypothetical protein [Nocardia sp. 852002-20019_SCH5090214]
MQRSEPVVRELCGGVVDGPIDPVPAFAVQPAKDPEHQEPSGDLQAGRGCMFGVLGQGELECLAQVGLLALDPVDPVRLSVRTEVSRFFTSASSVRRSTKLVISSGSLPVR